MDNKADQIKQRIQKLNQQLQKLEEKNERAIARLVKDTSKKGMDIKLLAGMILNAKTVIEANPKELEAWQQAGEKFLGGAKRKPDQSKNKAAAKYNSQKA